MLSGATMFRYGCDEDVPEQLEGDVEQRESQDDKGRLLKAAELAGCLESLVIADDLVIVSTIEVSLRSVLETALIGDFIRNLGSVNAVDSGMLGGWLVTSGALVMALLVVIDVETYMYAMESFADGVIGAHDYVGQKGKYQSRSRETDLLK